MADDRNDCDVVSSPAGNVLLAVVSEVEAAAFCERFNEREARFPIGVTAFVHQKCTKAAPVDRVVHNKRRGWLAKLTGNKQNPDDLPVSY